MDNWNNKCYFRSMMRGFLLAVCLVLAGLNKVSAVTIDSFRTGYNEVANSMLGDNAADTNWVITAISGAGDGTVPRSAQVQHGVTSGWSAPLGGTSFSRYITRGNSSTGTIGLTYTYSYQFTLNTSTFTDFVLSGAVQADNQVRILLNGNEILAQTGDIRGAGATSFSTSNQGYFQNGVNTLSFEVLNTSQGSTGLNATGIVTATAVPEPYEWAMIFGAGGLLLWWRRRDAQAWLESVSTPAKGKPCHYPSPSLAGLSQ